MRPSTVTQVGVGISTPVPVDIYCPSTFRGVQCVVTGAATYSLEVTMDNVWDTTPTPFWSVLNDLQSSLNSSGAATSQNGYTAEPFRAIRINQTAGAGSVRMVVVQQSLA